MSARAISPEAFVQKLRTLLTVSKAPWPAKIGLAISGGVDSMALALLCSQDPLYRSTYTPFIVDHRARKDSHLEAQWVAKELQGIGLPAEVLTIQWPNGYEPTSSRTFEQEARKARYDVLGRACANHGIKSLLLAHHNDDQAETVFSRLLNRRFGFGLRAMQEISDIPECNGVPMVHQIPTISSLGHEFGIADKGVQILRPLLAYSKIELQDTCRAAKMPWVEDATNADPTLTLRNAVRFILSPSKARTEAESSELLPVALRKRSLIEISKRAAEMEQRVEEKAQECFNGCKISLNISSGTLNLEVPADVFRMISSTTGKDGEHHYRGWFKVTAALLRRLVRLITPTESILLPNLVSAVPRFLPQDLLEPTEKNHTQQSQIFLVSGVQFTPLGENTWRLTARIPMENGEAPELTHSDLLQRSYHLWDGRFWILLHNVSEQLEVKIRRFRKEDAERFYACFNPKQRKTVKAILGEFCPAKGRFTLPAIVAKDEGGRERVIALPTMRIKIPQKKIPRELQNLTCSVRYKHVDLGSHDLNKVVTSVAPKRPKK